MNPVEAAARAACQTMGVDPDLWRTFAEIATTATAAFVEALPDDLRGPVRGYIDTFGGD